MKRNRNTLLLCVVIAAVLGLGTVGSASAGGLNRAVVKKIAAKIIKKKAPSLSVKHAKTADSATEAATADRLDGLDSTDFLPATGKATDADKLDGKDSSEFLEGCDPGALWGRALISGAQVTTTSNPANLSGSGVYSAYSCQGDAVVARKASTGNYNIVFGADVVGNTVGKAGPPPVVSAMLPNTVVTGNGPFQCAGGNPPPLYEICYTVSTTNLTGAAVDAPFVIVLH